MPKINTWNLSRYAPKYVGLQVATRNLS